MTTANARSRTPPPNDSFPFPDPPPKHPDDMTSFDHLAATGNVKNLAFHLGNPETTLVAGEHYLAPRPTQSMSDSFYPDLLIAFNVDPAAYVGSNGYAIEEQGKPPDFVLEIASRHTGGSDTGNKRRTYAALGVPEYWRFDETGRYHGTKLAGDRLVDGRYEPFPVNELPDGALQGYSPVLNLYLRWEEGQLAWHDPATGEHIPTIDSERERAESESRRAEREHAALRQEQAARTQEQAARLQAEARVRELEAELRRLRDN